MSVDDLGSTRRESATAPPRAKVLLVAGSARPDSNLQSVVGHLERALDDAGAQRRTLDLAEVSLPLMQYGEPTQDGDPDVKQARDLATWAQGLVIVTPEYHGSMSGALKNWFDFLYGELAGKFAATVAVTGGGYGEMSITAVRNCLAWCHAFTLPFSAAARGADFDENGDLVSAMVIERLGRVAYDVVRYAPVINDTFEQARRSGAGVEAGVAGRH